MPTFVSEAERREILTYFFERFGIPEEAFRGFHLLRGGSTVWVVSEVPGLDEALTKLRIEAAGIPLLRLKKAGWKPTTAGLQVFGRYAIRNIIDLDDEALKAFLGRGVVQGTFSVEAGYVVVRWRGKVLGCGLYGKRGLFSQIPSDWWRRGECTG